MGIKVKTSYKGRVCRYPHCKHILSIYNHQLYCHIHLGEVNCKQHLKKSKNNAA